MDGQLPDGDWSTNGRVNFCHQRFFVYPGPTSNPSLTWKKADIFKINGDDDDVIHIIWRNGYFSTISVIACQFFVASCFIILENMAMNAYMMDILATIPERYISNFAKFITV